MADRSPANNELGVLKAIIRAQERRIEALERRMDAAEARVDVIEDGLTKPRGRRDPVERVLNG